MSYESIVSTGIPEHPQVAAVGDFSMKKFCKDDKKRWKLVTEDNIIRMFANDINFLMERDDARKKQPHKQVLNSSKEK